MSFRISRADVHEPDVATLLDRHFALMRAQSPPESCHVLPKDELSHPDITLYALREDDVLLAIGAIRDFGPWGEVKSMHTAKEARGRGAARALLDALIASAAAKGMQHLSLETGSGPEHMASRRLYASAGFADCPPFGNYTYDPLSHFMTRAI
ncbi:N-acetyltransferase [Roseobacter cerasinus]|uniref:N-acetyltransferase n=1 Tax=Roseobacter cerasinus TaxID=2602289 RepID=A0A640VZB4_9RHOB|nr:GNAT family N-acetyltransferase [Roseobacter cerasinus]GFE52315.1 N-acetyltransferase [Roseobacter cerasinus]